MNANKTLIKHKPMPLVKLEMADPIVIDVTKKGKPTGRKITVRPVEMPMCETIYGESVVRYRIFLASESYDIPLLLP